MGVDTPLRAVLFDLDGTLLDTAPDIIGALNRLRGERGLDALPSALVRASVSHGTARLIEVGFPNEDNGENARLQSRLLELYAGAISAGTRLFDGMDAVLESLDERGLRYGIVTNKPAHLTGKLLDELDLTSRFACIVSGDTVAKAKPHALPMLHAAQLAEVSAAECVYAGDAERDMQAARAAGMTGLVATYGYLYPGEDWRAWGADGSIDRPVDLLSWLDDSGRV